jgi:hypothetical protein
MALCKELVVGVVLGTVLLYSIFYIQPFGQGEDLHQIGPELFDSRRVDGVSGIHTVLLIGRRYSIEYDVDSGVFDELDSWKDWTVKLCLTHWTIL